MCAGAAEPRPQKHLSGATKRCENMKDTGESVIILSPCRRKLFPPAPCPGAHRLISAMLCSSESVLAFPRRLHG